MLIRTTKKPVPGGSIRAALTANHSETLLGGPIRSAVQTNRSERLPGGPITTNHSETLLVPA
jgi:hypothetical protein